MGVNKQPGTNIKFTNVAVVRIRKGKMRFEVVCYRNKIQDWRRGVEKDLDEVVQVPYVFVNSSKGEVASTSDLQNAFGSTDVNKIILDILNTGEEQVGAKERQQQQKELRAKVLELVAAKCVNTRTKKPYPVTIIEKTLSELKFQFTSKPSKSQALDAIKMLVEKQVIPIARAHMRVRISDDLDMARTYSDKLKEIVEMESEKLEPSYELVGLIDPGTFRALDKLVETESKGSGLVEIVSLSVTN